MSTKLVKNTGVPEVGRYPTSVVTDATDGRNLIDGLKTARQQPVLWQPHLHALQPFWKAKGSGQGDELVLGASFGDLAPHESGLSMFNGRVFKDQGGLNRHTLVERFALRPRTSGGGGIGDNFSTDAEYDAGSIDKRFFVASRNCIITGVRLTPTVAGTDAGVVTAMVEKTATTEAIGSGTNVLTATFNLKGTADVVQVGSLGAPSAITLAVGDSLALNLTGVMTNATGVVTVDFQEIDANGSAWIFGVNPNLAVGGTNATSNSTNFDAGGGITLNTGASSADQGILIPESLSAWGATNWNTAKRLLLEGVLATPATITSSVFWFGWRLTNPAPFDLTTDNDQLLVWYDSSVDGFLHATYSIGGVDASAILMDGNNNGVPLLASTKYVIEVGVDDLRRPYAIVNGVLHLYGTALSSLSTLIPSVGVETKTTEARALTVRSLAASMDY